ncbi:MAG: ankyrin repeat domain-containing protein [Akkermansia sp.]|nr:ankyrin repeat domain-containing protein [Akkermansia sp.]
MNFKHLITVAALAATALSTTSCRSTLYRAAERGDMQAVQHELNTGANPDGKASLGNLFWQIPAGLVAVPLDMTRILASLTYVWITIDPMLYLDNKGHLQIDSDESLSKRIFTFNGKTAAVVAEENNHMDIVEELILAGGDASYKAMAKMVSDAARQGDVTTLRKLLQQGINPDWNCFGDYSPLMLAIGSGHEECARLLLSMGAKFTSDVTINGSEITCYEYAASKGQLALYKKLGGPVIAPESVKGKTIVFQYNGSEPQKKKYIDGNDRRAINRKCGYYNNYGNMNKIKLVEYAAYTYPGHWYADGKSGRTSPLKFEFPNGNTNRRNKNRCQTYKKTGTNTARLEVECSWSGLWYLTFDSPTSGYATYVGADSDYMIEEKNIRFTIK